MSDLQIGLIAVGSIVVCGVIAFNWLQARRYRQRAEQAFGQAHRGAEDVLLRGTEITAAHRIEPRLDAPASAPMSDPDHQAETALDHFNAVGYAGENDRSNAESVADGDATDDATYAAAHAATHNEADFVLSLHPGTPLAASTLAPLLSPLLSHKFDFGKTVRWYGQQQQHAAWEEITPDAGGNRPAYLHLQASMQMVDRAGCASAVNLSAFRDLAQNFATQTGATLTCPDIEVMHARAVKLDQFCADVDVMIGINIISKDGGALTGTKIRALAEASGLRLEPDGVFGYRHESGALLFALHNFEAAPFQAETIRTLTTHGITLLLDVPRVAGGDKVFEQMAHLAGIFATTLGGMMVDDNRVPLNDAGLDKLKQQLRAIQSAMLSRNIPAGSALALRLFA